MDSKELTHRALGAYLGFAVGDAFGATVEFMTPQEIAAVHGTHRRILGGGWLKLRPGQVTDDTEMTLCLGEAILACGGFDARATAEAFVRWLQAKPVDVGNTCRRGIQRYIATGILEAPPNEGDAGNGACMRNLPVTLASLGDESLFNAWTLGQCRLTHHHPLSDAATLTLGRMMQQLLLGGGHKACRAETNRLLAQFPVFRFLPYSGRASSYIVDTVQTVLHFFFTTDNFEHCVTAVVNQGGDADTTGALAGMLAGAAYGMEAIPRRWLTALDPDITRRIKEQTQALLQLMATRGAAQPTHGR